MVGAGQVIRIFNQLEAFPIDIIGNYGMQYGTYNAQTKSIDIVRNITMDCHKQEIIDKVTMLREKYGFTTFAGETVEFHPSGCVTFPILETGAKQEDKLTFDPDRSKRRRIYEDVVNTFSDYCVFVGGSSSFDNNFKQFRHKHLPNSCMPLNGFPVVFTKPEKPSAPHSYNNRFPRGEVGQPLPHNLF